MTSANILAYLRRMAKRCNYSDTIRLVEKGGTAFFKGVNARSIQTICTQVAAEHRKKRKYVTAKQGGGIKVWRVE